MTMPYPTESSPEKIPAKTGRFLVFIVITPPRLNAINIKYILVKYSLKVNSEYPLIYNIERK